MDDYLNSHQIAFSAVATDFDVQVESSKAWGTPTDVSYEYLTSHQGHISGTVPIEGTPTSVDVSASGSDQWAVGGSYSNYDAQEQLSGSASQGEMAVTIASSSRSTTGHNANLNEHILNRQLWNDSSTSYQGTVYQFNNGYVSWAAGSVLGDPGTFNVVIDPSYWSASGTVTRDGALFGTIRFDGPVVADSHGPELILDTGGEAIVLHTLIVYP